MSSPNDQLQATQGEVPLAYQVVRGGAWVAASRYWMLAFGFVANVILTRLLSPEVFGSFALAMFFAQLLRLQPKLGIGLAFVRQVEATGRSVGTFLILESATVFGGLALTAVAAPLLVRFGYGSGIGPITLALAVFLCLEGIAGIAGSMLDRELKFGCVAAIQAAAFPLSYLPALWLATHGGGVWSLVAQGITYNLFSCVGIWWAVYRYQPGLLKLDWRFDAQLARDFLTFGATAGAGLLAAGLLTQLDNFLIGTFVSISVLGYYDRAYRIAQWPQLLLLGLLTRPALMSYTRLRDDKARLDRSLIMVTWLITNLALPMALAIFIAAPDLIVVLYGEKWLPSVPFLRILIALSVAFPLLSNATNLFLAIGKPRIPTACAIAQVLILGLLGVPLTISWGAMGTCVALGLALVLGVVFSYYHTVRETALRPARLLGMPAAISLLLLVVYLGINWCVNIDGMVNPLGRAVLKIAFGGLGFYLLVFVMDRRATYERVAHLLRLAKGSSREP